MNILMVTPEAAPYVRTGDVANVVTGLSMELRRKGHDTRIVLPYYRGLALSGNPRPVITDLDVPLGAYSRKATILRIDYEHDSLRRDTLPIYLIENQFYFGRENPYGYLDDYERFIFFTRAVIEMLQHSDFTSELSMLPSNRSKPWKPDVIHGHDWTSGCIPTWLYQIERDRTLKPINTSDQEQLKKTNSPAFVYTIHNAGFQGNFGYRAINVAGIRDFGVYRSIGESTHSINFMARGILAADLINTVSPRHAQELQGGGYANDLAKALKHAKKTIRGILNGIDFTEYNPALDPYVNCRFDKNTLYLRQANKQDLQAKCNLDKDPSAPVLGIVSRLIAEKGIDLLEQIIDRLIQEDHVQLVILGITGDYRYREVFAEFAQKYAQQVFVSFHSDEVSARRVYAGSDIILMPSLHEPCGLQQMIGMRYGAVPVVRRTGGLEDSVAPWDAVLSSSNDIPTGRGFLFDSFDPESLLQAIRDALKLYHDDRNTWEKLQRHNMEVDFSWERSVNQYEQLYDKAIAGSKSRPDLPLGKPLHPDRSDMLVHAILEVDELAMTIDQSDYLKQTVRSARELLQCDAVLIWKMDEHAQQQLSLEDYSIKRDSQQPQQDFDKRLYTVFSEHGNRSWQYIYRLSPEEAATSVQLGFLNSELARKQGWTVQLTVPMTTHGTTLGRIDAFNQTKEFDDWDRNAIGAFANAVAGNLEKLRLNKRAEHLLAADREMAKAQTVDELAQYILRHARLLTNADSAHLYLSEHSFYSLDQHDQFKVMVHPEIGNAQPPLPIAGTHISTLDENTLLETPAGSDTPLQSRSRYSSSIRAALTHSQQQGLGTIEVVKMRPMPFSRDDETVLEYLATQAANVLQAAHMREQRDQSRVEQLGRLAASLIGGLDFKPLLEQVVDTTAAVLEAQAASLYLINEDTGRLEIQAAAGYHRPLLDQKASYDVGEGTTGWIAQTGKTFKADSLEELHNNTPWHGKHKGFQGNREPNAFLGIPLKIVDRVSGRQRVIGVLKLEDRLEKSLQPQTIFSDEDVRLGEMMSNVIATVVYNTQLSEKRLRELSTNLGQLSGALAGSQDTQTLMDNIVNTIAEVLKVDAATLYLADEHSQRLVIQAAYGYQKPLVDAQAFYEWGEGVTGRIAETNQPFQANKLEVLRDRGGSRQGKYDHLQGNQRPTSFYGLPLNVKGRNKPIGVLKVESLAERPFTNEDVLLIEMMANVIATVVYNAQLSEKRLRELSTNLGQLSGALAGSQDTQTLMDNIVNTIAEVLKVDAATLYLIEEPSQRLVIQAAYGYQAPLVDAHAFYEWGEGVTGRIAETNQPFQANKLEVLRDRGGSEQGKYDPLQGNQRPTSFYGLPLNVKGRDKPIGVLKVESLAERPFTGEDVLLIQMMANVIATVVYNAQLSEKRLRELNINLSKLSGALAGSQDTLMDDIVNTIAEVLKVDAATLYLADEHSQRLVIQAAYGYQKPLVIAQAFYEWGEGVTGRIAETNQPFQANKLTVLRHQGGSTQGKYDYLQGNQRPTSFYGLPLNVKGRDKPIGVLKVESLAERPFTGEDVLLIQMMANVIATVVYNDQLDRERLATIVRSLGSVASPRPEASRELLTQFAQSSDRGTITLLTAALESKIGSDTEQAFKEAIALLKANAKLELFTSIAGVTQSTAVQRRFNLFYQASRNEQILSARLSDVYEISHLWAHLEERNASPEDFQSAVEAFVNLFSAACKAEPTPPKTIENWCGIVLDTARTFGDTYLPDRLPIVMHRQGYPQDSDLADLRHLLRDHLEDRKHILLPLWGDKEEIERTRTMLRNKFQQPFAIDTVVLEIERIQQIIGASRPDIELQRAVLSQLDLSRISPYRIVGPIDDRIFFGREEELREISEGIRQSSFAVIGGRRIGKTSILGRLSRVRLPAIGFDTIYRDCSTTPTYTSFIQAEIRNWQPTPPANAPETFSDLLDNLPGNRPIVLLLDEADKFVPNDRADGWRFFGALRALVNSGHAQVILSGERTLREALRDPKSPLFNFTNEILLGPLKPLAVEELVTRPMRQLEIELVDEATIVRRIYDFTSGHPNVVQRLCSRLIKLLNERGTRYISLEDINSVIEDPSFQRDDFLSTYWETATNLEKIISLLMADDIRVGTLTEVQHALAARCSLQPKARDVDDALQSLVELRSILRRTTTGYEFAVEAFPRVVAGTITLDDMLKVFTESYREEQQ